MRIQLVAAALVACNPGQLKKAESAARVAEAICDESSLLPAFPAAEKLREMCAAGKPLWELQAQYSACLSELEQ